MLTQPPDWSVMSILSSDWSILTGPGPGDDGGGVASGDGRGDLAQGLGAEGGLDMDVGLSGDLLVNY